MGIERLEGMRQRQLGWRAGNVWDQMLLLFFISAQDVCLPELNQNTIKF